MGLLDGNLATAIYKGFKGKLLVGIIRQHTTPDSGSLDALGDPIEIDPVDTAMEGFVDGYSAFYRAQAGIPETDMKVCIFAKSCPSVTPSKDDLVRFTQAGVQTWYQVRAVAVDPALALWECQAFEVPEPA